MDRQTAQDLVRKIIENASTRAIGWILEQHYELILNTKLEIVFVGNHRMARELIHEPETIDTLKSIVRTVMGRDVNVIVRDASPEDMVRKIIESASTRALGWILEQHCQLHITDTTLEVVFQGNHRMAHELLHEDDTLRTLQQIAHMALGRDIAVRIIDAPVWAEAPAKTEALQPQKTNDALFETPVSNQGRQFDKEKPVFVWENLRFRSHTEIRIAQALDRRKVLFLPNCAARLGFSQRQNREADFLVCDKGKWGILEVDSPDSHPPARTVEDHERARLFQAHGILLVQHFDGGECFENADGVVDKFLYLLRNQK